MDLWGLIKLLAFLNSVGLFCGAVLVLLSEVDIKSNREVLKQLAIYYVAFVSLPVIAGWLIYS